MPYGTANRILVGFFFVADGWCNIISNCKVSFRKVSQYALPLSIGSWLTSSVQANDSPSFLSSPSTLLLSVQPTQLVIIVFQIDSTELFHPVESRVCQHHIVRVQTSLQGFRQRLLARYRLSDAARCHRYLPGLSNAPNFPPSEKDECISIV